MVCMLPRANIYKVTTATAYPPIYPVRSCSKNKEDAVPWLFDYCWLSLPAPKLLCPKAAAPSPMQPATASQAAKMANEHSMTADMVDKLGA